MPVGAVRLHLVEDALLVLKDLAEEVVLDVLAPERNAIVLLKMTDLVARIDRRDAPVGIASRRRRRRCVDGRLELAWLWGAPLERILPGVALVGPRRVDLRRGRLYILHGRGLFSEDVLEAVPGVGLVGVGSGCWHGCGRAQVLHDERLV